MKYNPNGYTNRTDLIKALTESQKMGVGLRGSDEKSPVQGKVPKNAESRPNPSGK